MDRRLRAADSHASVGVLERAAGEQGEHADRPLRTLRGTGAYLRQVGTGGVGDTVLRQPIVGGGVGDHTAYSSRADCRARGLPGTRPVGTQLQTRGTRRAGGGGWARRAVLLLIVAP